MKIEITIRNNKGKKLLPSRVYSIGWLFQKADAVQTTIKSAAEDASSKLTGKEELEYKVLAL